MARILLLEDNHDLQVVLRQVGELAGHKVLTGRSGVEGLTILEQESEPFDVVICDLAMPEMDGVTFLQHLRGDPRWSSIYFVAMSGNEHDRVPAFEAGANEYLGKPFSIHDLNAMLAQYLSSRS